MGRVTATWNAKGITVAGVILGEPAEEDGMFVWDGGEIPDGRLNRYGTIITPGTDVDNVPLDVFVGVTGQELPEPDVPEPVIDKVAPELKADWLEAATEPTV